MVSNKSGNNIRESAIAFIRLLGKFECKREPDPYWQIIFPVKGQQWAHMHISEYQNVFYVTEKINSASIEIEPGRNRVEAGNGFIDLRNTSFDNKKWDMLLTAAISWLRNVEKNWMLANKLVFEKFPVKYRKGIVPASVVAEYFPEYNHLQKKAGIRNARKMVSVVDKGVVTRSEAGTAEKLTANVFFEYCKLAYEAVGLAKEGKSGRELYKLYADGRHEGLLDIDLDSAEEFADWIDGKHPQKQPGGHPWEILRGGNTSNIQLNVRRPVYSNKTSFKIEVYATGISRLAECIKIFLKIYNTGKPIAIREPDNIREQLLLLDNIGILPEYSSLHRGAQAFEESQHVNDVVLLRDIRKYFLKIKPFITWEPLPILKKKNL